MARRPSTNVVNAGAIGGAPAETETLIDHDHLERQTAGDAGLQRELLTLFLGQLDELDAHLDRVAEPAALTETMRLLHRIRGAAEAVGARELAETLARAEADCGDPAASALWPARLRSELRTVRAHLSRLIAADNRGGLAKPPESR